MAGQAIVKRGTFRRRKARRSDHGKIRSGEAYGTGMKRRATSDQKNDKRSLLALILFCLIPASGGARELEDVTGKVFKVAPREKSFELLKETEVDPETDEGVSRVTVHWDAETEVTKVVRHRNFEKIEGRVLAGFYNLSGKWADAIEKGKGFRTRSVRIFAEGGRKAGLSEDRKSLVGWLTVDPADPHHRKGTVEVDGRTIEFSLPGPNGAVDVYSNAGAKALATGFWEATVWAEESGKRLVASRLELHPKVDPRTVDDPDLPRVLVVGDSISMNYHEAAKKELEGVANYYRVEGNAGPSDRGVSCMELWLGNYREKGLHWDLIQFNHGLHDLKQGYDEETKKYGKHQISLKEYQENLEKEIAILKKTGATLMWCSTTPVPNSSVGRWDNVTMGRRKDEDLVFNQAAMEVIKRHPEILINDLNATVREAAKTTPAFEPWKKGKDVHFWHRPQQEIVGRAVAKAVDRALSDRQNDAK